MSQPSVAPHDAPRRDPDDLPVRPPELMLGRDSDIAAVHLALKASQPVLLYGAPGSGKSALAAAVAAERTGAEGGVLWLDLAEDSLRSLLARVARAYGAVLLPGGDQAEHAAIVRDLLRANRPLLVLDGVVNLPAARAFVEACCDDQPALLTYAHAATGPWTLHAVGPLSRDDSEALLILISGPDVDADVSEIARVAEITGGYPLAIVIAGRALAAGVTPDEFLAQLPDLPRGAVNGMLAVILAAYRLLPPALQGVALLLGTAFGAGASEALLAEITETPPAALRPALRQLVKRGFASSHAVYGQPYYTAHELVRHFAKAFLRGKDQLETVRARQMSGLLRFVRQQTGENDTAHHDRLAAEIGGVLAGARYAARHGRTEQLEELVLRLDPSGDDDFAAARGFQTELKWLWHLLDEPQAASVPLLAWASEPVEAEPLETGEPSLLPAEAPAAPAAAPVSVEETLAWMEDAPIDETFADEAPADEAGGETAPDVPAPVDDASAAGPDTARGGEPVPPEQDTLRAGLDDETDFEPLDEADAAIEDLTSVLEQIASEPLDEAPEDRAGDLSEARPDEPGAPPALPEQGAVEAAQDEPAAPPAEQAPAPMTRAEAARLRHLAKTAAEAQDTEHAIAYYARALDTYHANGQVSDELAALEALAALSLERSDYENVLNYVDRGMALAEQADDPHREGKLLTLLGDLQSQLGRTEGAEIAYQEAIRALRPGEAWLEIGQVLDKLGALYLDTGRPEDAIAVLEQATPIFERVQRDDLLADTLDALGEAHAALLDWTSARRTYRRAVALAQAAGDTRQTFEVLSRLGHVLEESGDYGGAQSAYRHALHLAFELDDQASIGESLVSLARMLMNDTIQLNRVVQLLDAAVARMPGNTEAQRLLSRAKTRQERLTAAGVTLMLPEDSVRDYAQAALDE